MWKIEISQQSSVKNVFEGGGRRKHNEKIEIYCLLVRKQESTHPPQPAFENSVCTDVQLLYRKGNSTISKLLSDGSFCLWISLDCYCRFLHSFSAGLWRWCERRRKFIWNKRWIRRTYLQASLYSSNILRNNRIRPSRLPCQWYDSKRHHRC